MSLDREVVNIITNNCPAGRKGLVVTKIYDNGNKESDCTKGCGSILTLNCPAGIAYNCIEAFY